MATSLLTLDPVEKQLNVNKQVRKLDTSKLKNQRNFNAFIIPSITLPRFGKSRFFPFDNSCIAGNKFGFKKKNCSSYKSGW